jgi:hypothetical protein
MRRHRRTSGILVIGVLCGAAVGAADAPAATWTGEAHGKVVRSTRLVTGGTTWRGSMWLRISREGVVRGHAVVAYEPVVDLAGLNNAIGYVKTVGSTAVGMLGPFGSAVSGAVLGQLVGAGVSFKSALAVRSGELTGRRKGDELKLRWKADLPGIPYDVNLVYASGQEPIGGGEAELADPFETDGERVGRRAIVAASESSTRPEAGVTRLSGAYWALRRVD